MSNPAFSEYDGSNKYIWEEFPDLPGDRPDLTSRMREKPYSLEHQRHGVTFARTVITELGNWDFAFRHITREMVSSLNHFHYLDKIRYYPDGAGGFYWTVFMVGDFDPRLQRGGKYNLTIKLQEI